MAIIVTAPNEVYTVESRKYHKLFLAGSISNAENWQEKACEVIDKHFKPLIVYNPRRPNFDINDKRMQEEQIVWEYEHLKDADLITFWFGKETVAPITLYEFGRWSQQKVSSHIIVGIDPDYSRKDDIIIQNSLNKYPCKIEIGFNNFIKKVKSIDLAYITKNSK